MKATSRCINRKRKITKRTRDEFEELNEFEKELDLCIPLKKHCSKSIDMNIEIEKKLKIKNKKFSENVENYRIESYIPSETENIFKLFDFIKNIHVESKGTVASVETYVVDNIIKIKDSVNKFMENKKILLSEESCDIEKIFDMFSLYCHEDITFAILAYNIFENKLFKINTYSRWNLIVSLLNYKKYGPAIYLLLKARKTNTGQYNINEYFTDFDIVDDYIEQIFEIIEKKLYKICNDKRKNDRIDILLKLLYSRTSNRSDYHVAIRKKLLCYQQLRRNWFDKNTNNKEKIIDEDEDEEIM